MELDHIFFITKTPVPIINQLHQFGLVEGSPNTHQGQGTACRRFFFSNAYIEILFVTDEKIIKQFPVAKTKLWERSNYKESKFSPFGLCFRKAKNSDNNEDIFQDSWKYKPPYLSKNQYIRISENENYPSEPMIFELSFQQFRPADYYIEKRQPLNHPIKLQEITSLTFALPSTINISSALKKIIQTNSKVKISTGIELSLNIEFDNGYNGLVKNFEGTMPMVFNW